MNKFEHTQSDLPLETVSRGVFGGPNQAKQAIITSLEDLQRFFEPKPSPEIALIPEFFRDSILVGVALGDASSLTVEVSRITLITGGIMGGNAMIAVRTLPTDLAAVTQAYHLVSCHKFEGYRLNWAVQNDTSSTNEAPTPPVTTG